MSNEQPDESEAIAGLAIRAVVAPKSLLLGDARVHESSGNDRLGPNAYAPDTSTPAGKSPWRLFQSPIFWLVFLVLLAFAILGLRRQSS